MQIDNQPIKVRTGEMKDRHASRNARAASSSPSSPREERVGRGPRRGATNKNAPPLPSPLLHPMEEREKSRSLMQRWMGSHGFAIGHWVLGIHWSLVIGHWSFLRLL